MQPISMDARPIRIWMTSNARWRATHMFPGRAAVIRCPGSYAGKEVWVRDHGHYVEVRHGAERIAVHDQAMQTTSGDYTQHEHHADIPLGNKQTGQDAHSYSAECSDGGAPFFGCL